MLNSATDGGTSEPLLSVVVVTVKDYRSLHRVLRFLRAQTIRDRIELVIVAPAEDSLAGLPPVASAGFARVSPVFVGTLDNRELASAAGIRAATAPFVALIEDHAFPEPAWAARLVARLEESWAAVGPAVVNANPGFLSWCNWLLAFAAWPVTEQPKEMEGIAIHNCGYRREVLLSYGPRLGDLLAREGGLLRTMRADGHRAFFEPAAIVNHTNPSTLTATVTHRINAGRLYAANRAEAEHWSSEKRWFYFLLGPALPAIQMVTRRRETLNGRKGAAVLRALPPLVIAFLLDSAGQMYGYAFGAGNTAAILANDEVIRWQHITARDRRRLSE